MKKLLPILLLLLTFLVPAAKSQGGYTPVSAKVLDPSGNVYVNSQVNITFYDPGTSGKLPLINGSTFQTTYTIYATDSFGRFSVNLPDNGTICATSGECNTQWRFTIIYQDRQTAFSGLFTICSGASCPSNSNNAPIDLTAGLQAIAAPIPSSSGGPSGAFSYVTVTSGPSPVFNATTNTGYAFTLTSNATATFGTPIKGTIYQFNLCENGTGGYTFTFPGNVVLPTNYTFNTNPNACNQVAFIYDGTNWQPWYVTGGSPGPPNQSVQVNINNQLTGNQNLTYNPNSDVLNFGSFQAKGPNPWFDLSRFGGYTGTYPFPSITCTTSASSNVITCPGGLSDFQVGHGVSIPTAGPASIAFTPGAAVPVTSISVSSNVATISARGMSISTGLNGVISGSSDSAFNGTFTFTNNGNGGVWTFPVTHANCNPCTIGSAFLANATSSAVTPQGVLNGTTTYNYKIVAEDINGGLSAASAAFTTITGAATLGVNSATIAVNGCTHGSNLLTFTTTATHNFQAGSEVNILAGSTGSSLQEGAFVIFSVPSSTTFTIQQVGVPDGIFCTLGGTARVVAKNLVQWPLQPYAAIRNYIYRSTGAGAYSLVGVEQGMDGSFEDWGTAPGVFNPAVLPAYIPATPPASPINGYLQTTITAINGTSITLASNATAAVTNATVLHDNASNIIQACTSTNNNNQGGAVYFPGSTPQGSAYPINSILQLSSCPNMTRLLFGAPMFINETIIPKGAQQFEGLGQGLSHQNPSFMTGVTSLVEGFAYPFFLLTPGVGNDITFTNLSMQCNQVYQTCVVQDQDAQGNNVTNETYNNIYLSTNAGQPYKLGGGFGFIWNGGQITNSEGQWGFQPNVWDVVQQGIGTQAQQLAGIVDFNYTGMNGGEILFDVGDYCGASLSQNANHMIFTEMLTESGFYPQIRFNTCTGSPVSQVKVENSTMADQLSGLSTPLIDLTTALATNGISIIQPSCNQGPLFSAGGQLGIEVWSGPLTGCSSLGITTAVFHGRFGLGFEDLYENVPAMSQGTGGQFGYVMATPTTPTATAGTGGSLPAGTYTYKIIPNDANGNQGPLSPISSGAVSDGTKQNTISWTPVPGQVSTTLCRQFNSGGLACATTGAAFGIVGNSFIDNLPGFNFSGSPPSFATGGSSTLGPAGLTSYQIKLVNNGFADTLNASLTANRTQTFQDATGAIPVVVGTPISTHCAQFTLTGAAITLTDSGFVCSGGGGGGATFQVNGTNTTNQSLINFVQPATFNGIALTVTNPSAGNVNFALSGAASNAFLANSNITLNTAAPLAGGGVVALGGTLNLTCSSCAGGGVNAKTISYTLVAADSGKTISFNGTTLTATLPASPPSTTWYARIQNLNSTSVTINPNALFINNVASNITLPADQSILISTDGTNYFTDTPPILAGTNVTVTPSPTGITLSSTGGGGSGAVNNCTVAGAMAYYATAGTTVSCDQNITTDGTGDLTANSYITSGSNGGLSQTEGTGANTKCPLAGIDCFWADSSVHRWRMNNNNGSNVVVGANPMTTSGDIIYGGTPISGVAPEVRLPAGTTTQVLHSGAVPFWGSVSLTTDVSGCLPIAQGGTNTCSTTPAHTFFGNNTGAAASPGMFQIGTNDWSPNSYVADSGAVNAYVATLSPAATSLAVGLEVRFLPANANTTTTPTLNVNSLGAKTITKQGTIALAASDLTTTAVATVIYDGTEWQLQNPQTTGGGAGSVTSVGLQINGGSSSGIFAATGSPVTSSGNLNYNLTGTSGGIPYFSSASVLSSSALLASGQFVLGGGAGAAPTTSFSIIPPPNGGSGLLSPTAHSLLVTEGASNYNLVTSPTTNGSYLCGFFVTASTAVDPTCPLAGVPVNAQSGNYSLLYSDRASYIKYSGGTTATLTLPQVTGNTASNYPFVVQNLNSGNLTVTANAADKINNGATGGSVTVPANNLAFFYQDNSSAPGNWWTIGLVNSSIAASGTVSSGNIGQMAHYAATGTTVSGIDLPEVHYFPAANCVAGTAGAGWDTATSNFTAACRAGTNNLTGTLQAIPSTGASAYFKFELPKDWDTTSQPFISIYYGSGANTSGTVIWTVSSACVDVSTNGGASDDPAFVAETAFASQTMAVANRLWFQNGQFANMTSGNGCKAQSQVLIKVAVSGTAASNINAYQAVMTIPRLPVVQAN